MNDTQMNNYSAQLEIKTEIEPLENIKIFTCISCNIKFKTNENQRNHMKSDWHRYNLKRKIINLPPISVNEFNEKLVEIQNDSIKNDKIVDLVCKSCQKTYSSEGALQSHLKSKKHLENSKVTQTINQYGIHTISHQTADSITRFSQVTGTFGSSIAPSSLAPSTTANSHIGEDNEDQKASSFRIRLGLAKTEQEIDDILSEKLSKTKRQSPLDCLFCSMTFSNGGCVEDNLEHMARVHSFFIPDTEFLVDPEGLIQYLSDKIIVANVCIYCNGKGRAFFSAEAVKAHMISKSHCKIPFEDGDEDEIAEFYEFGGDHEWVDQLDDDDDDDMDEQDEDMEQDEEEEEELNKRKVVFQETQMILPSGKRIGHRAFRRYWSQNLRPIRIIPGSRADPNMQSRIQARYHSLGQQVVHQRNSSSALMTREERLQVKVEKREARRRLVRQQDHTARVGQKHNMLQHHYREQNPF